MRQSKKDKKIQRQKEKLKNRKILNKLLFNEIPEFDNCRYANSYTSLIIKINSYVDKLMYFDELHKNGLYKEYYEYQKFLWNSTNPKKIWDEEFYYAKLSTLEDSIFNTFKNYDCIIDELINFIFKYKKITYTKY